MLYLKFRVSVKCEIRNQNSDLENIVNRKYKWQTNEMSPSE
jgi:hypothetical protein